MLMISLTHLCRNKAMRAAAFSADGSALAVATDTVITLWDPDKNLLVAIVGETPSPQYLSLPIVLSKKVAVLDSLRNPVAILNNVKKVLLTGFRSLPPLFEDTPNAVHELTIARDIYEHAVVLSVKLEDQDAFERDFFQLKPYYTDACNRLPPSPQEYPLLDLNLLRLLVQNRIAEFHTELELLSSTALENPCIKHVVELEQSFMEGAYNRVLSARQTVPHDTYVYFMDLLAKTVSTWTGSDDNKAALLRRQRATIASGDSEVATASGDSEAVSGVTDRGRGTASDGRDRERDN
ncbi:hypothetical protein RIF29_19944 [Crotalaria pallida]|uniref:CSN8/PSMD8/EIF3K domain-containing protein n=1 Tax=Crotalaria pallida TaxID=3830 RepID=A0AAN9I5X3_CROPI